MQLSAFKPVILVARTVEQLRACYPVFKELRPHFEEEAFLEQARNQQKKGYNIAFIAVQEKVVCVAGYRVSESLARGRFLYIDDLVTVAACQKQGHASQLLDWLVRLATELQCRSVRLDSGIERKSAHQFYGNRKMTFVSRHYALPLK
jgi:GNAT superfamily N-acetyltransferase